jgi:hypothetical protein
LAVGVDELLPGQTFRRVCRAVAGRAGEEVRVELQRERVGPLYSGLAGHPDNAVKGADRLGHDVGDLSRNVVTVADGRGSGAGAARRRIGNGGRGRARHLLPLRAWIVRAEAAALRCRRVRHALAPILQILGGRRLRACRCRRQILGMRRRRLRQAKTQRRQQGADQGEWPQRHGNEDVAYHASGPHRIVLKRSFRFLALHPRASWLRTLGTIPITSNQKSGRSSWVAICEIGTIGRRVPRWRFLGGSIRRPYRACTATLVAPPTLPPVSVNRTKVRRGGRDEGGAGDDLSPSART